MLEMTWKLILAVTVMQQPW